MTIQLRPGAQLSANRVSRRGYSSPAPSSPTLFLGQQEAHRADKNNEISPEHLRLFVYIYFFETKEKKQAAIALPSPKISAAFILD